MLADAGYLSMEATDSHHLTDSVADRETKLQHARWMCSKMITMPSDLKAMRWLCFIQGVLWSCGITTVCEMREDNRSAKLVNDSMTDVELLRIMTLCDDYDNRSEAMSLLTERVRACTCDPHIRVMKGLVQNMQRESRSEDRFGVLTRYCGRKNIPLPFKWASL
jgi:hypothetical protein